MACTDFVEPASVLDLFSPRILIVDCRRILRVGLLPGSIVFRRRRQETLEQAMDRLVEDVMFSSPPEDRSRALLLDCTGSESGEEAADVAGVAAYLRSKLGCKHCLRVHGGARALMEAHSFLFGLAMTDLPSRLSELTRLAAAGAPAPIVEKTAAADRADALGDAAAAVLRS